MEGRANTPEIEDQEEQIIVAEPRNYQLVEERLIVSEPQDPQVESRGAEPPCAPRFACRANPTCLCKNFVFT